MLQGRRERGVRRRARHTLYAIYVLQVLTAIGTFCFARPVFVALGHDFASRSPSSPAPSSSSPSSGRARSSSSSSLLTVGAVGGVAGPLAVALVAEATELLAAENRH